MGNCLLVQWSTAAGCVGHTFCSVCRKVRGGVASGGLLSSWCGLRWWFSVRSTLGRFRKKPLGKAWVYKKVESVGIKVESNTQVGTEIRSNHCRKKVNQQVTNPLNGRLTVFEF